MIKHILFDLDCTLYSVSLGLEENVSRRVHEFASSWLSLPLKESERQRKEALKHYGTTLEWLITEKGFTATDDYFSFIHPEDEADSLLPDPELRKFIENLPCPSSILTNSPFSHADRILKKLKFEGIFCHVFDIISNGFKGKPDEAAYRRALNTLALKPEEVLFIDDMPRYVEGYLTIGGKGILLDELDTHKNYPCERIKNIKDLIRFLDH